MKDKLGSFLQNIWGTGGRVFLAYKSTPSNFDVPPPRQWPDDKERISDFILAASAKSKDVYFSPAIYKPDAIDKSKGNVLKSRTLWIDLDGNAAEALATVQTEGLPVPTYRLQSGPEGHEHWFWILDGYKSLEEFEPINKRLAYHLNGDKGCWDGGRVMRLPYTANFKPKYNGVDLPVSIIAFEKAKYSLNDFDALPSVKHSIVENTSELGDIPPIGTVLAKYNWDDRHLDIFNNPPTGKGGRSDSLVRLAYFGAEVGMSDEAIYAVISDVDSRIKKFVGRADREDRLAEIIAKARNKYPFVGSTFTSSDTSIQQVFTINELLQSEFELDWLVEGLLPRGTVNFISAESGIGKSRLSMQLAEALAKGGKFLHWNITRKIKTMYLSLEMDGPMLKHFAEGLSHKKEYSQEDSDNFLLVPVGNPINLVSEEGTRYIKYILDEYRPEVLMIDALGSLTLDELGEVQSKSINNKLNEFIAEYGTTFFVIHHNKKPQGIGKPRPTLGDVYGSQYVVANGALVLTMWMEENQSNVELILLKTRARPENSDVIMMDGTRGFHFTLKEKIEVKEEDRGFGL